jgi:hypothetical protein
LAKRATLIMPRPRLQDRSMAPVRPGAADRGHASGRISGMTMLRSLGASYVHPL